MNKLILLAMSFFSAQIYAWECPENRGDFDTRTHWHVAEDVLLGRVIGGIYLEHSPNGGQREYVFRINESLKGKREGVIAITIKDDGITNGMDIGQSYVVFLYGQDSIDFCSKVIAVPASSMQGLDQMKDYYSENKYELALAEKIRLIFELSEYEP